MGIESFIPEIVSGQIQNQLLTDLVFGAVFQRFEMPNGDRLRINLMNHNSATAYTPNSSTLTYSQIDTAPIYLDINRSYSSNFYVEDTDRVQAAGDVVSEASRLMGYALAKEVDVYLASLYAQAMIVNGLGTSGTPIDVTSLNVVEYLGLVNQKMDEADVPYPRWCVAPSWFLRKVELADITLNTANSSTLANGFQGNALGFNFFKSNNVSEATASTHQGARIMFGYAETGALAQQVSTVEQLRADTTFRTQYRALNVYGAKIIRPNTLALLRADYTAEP